MDVIDKGLPLVLGDRHVSTAVERMATCQD